MVHNEPKPKEGFRSGGVMSTMMATIINYHQL